MALAEGPQHREATDFGCSPICCQAHCPRRRGPRHGCDRRTDRGVAGRRCGRRARQEETSTCSSCQRTVTGAAHVVPGLAFYEQTCMTWCRGGEAGRGTQLRFVLCFFFYLDGDGF